MVINPAPLLRLNDADAQAGQIQSRNGQAEQQAIEGIGGREATGGPLEATGLLGTLGFESARSASRTHPGFWRTSAPHSPRERRSSGCSSRQVSARWTGPTAAPKIDTSWKKWLSEAGWTEPSSGRDRLARQMNQGAALQPQAKMPLKETIPAWGQTARLVKEHGRAEGVDGDALLPASTQLAPMLEWSHTDIVGELASARQPLQVWQQQPAWQSEKQVLKQVWRL